MFAIPLLVFVRRTKTTYLYFLGFSWAVLDKVSVLGRIDAGIVNKTISHYPVTLEMFRRKQNKLQFQKGETFC